MFVFFCHYSKYFLFCDTLLFAWNWIVIDQLEFLLDDWICIDFAGLNPL